MGVWKSRKWKMETDTESGNGRGKWKILHMRKTTPCHMIGPQSKRFSSGEGPLISACESQSDTSMECAGSQTDPIQIQVGSSDSR